jgi:hypothetical protein
MDINKGRIILTHMQICFQDMNLPIMSDKEELNDPFISHHLSFKSWYDREDYHAEILGIVVFEHNIIQLSMNFYSKNIWSKYPSILKMLNLINLARVGYYWQIVPAHKKFEFRTAMIITGGSLNVDQFKSVLKRFLDLGLGFYPLINQFQHSNIKPQKLLNKYKSKNRRLWLNDLI